MKIEPQENPAGYLEFAGRKYFPNPSRKFYVAQRNGKANLLHRDLFAARHGQIPKWSYVICVGDWNDFSEANWKIGTRSEATSKPRHCARKHPVQEFNGMVFYRNQQGYFYTAPEKGYVAMHRAVWEAANCPIPEGHHVHHKNGDKADNRLENLQMIEGGEHSRLHNRLRALATRGRN